MPRSFSFIRAARARAVFAACAAACAAAALAACASDSPTAPRNQTPDVAALVAQMSSVGSSGQAAANASLSLFAGVAPGFDPASCPYSAGARAFVCAPVAGDGLTFSLTYYLYDANGASLSAPSTAVESIRAVIDGSGTLASTGGLGSQVIAEHQDLTLSDLEQTNHLLNGTGHSRDSLVLSGPEAASVVSNLSSATRNVVLPPPNTGGVAWPLSGTITGDDTTMTTAFDAPPLSVTSHAAITFNGSSTPAIVITVDGVTAHCTFTLGGTAAPVCS